MNKGIKTLLTKEFWIRNNCILILIVLIIVSSILSDVFLTMQNISNLLRQTMPLLIMSIGLLFAILTGGIDLSIGAIMGIGNMVTSYMLHKQFGDSVGGLFVSAILAIAVGCLFGLFSGFLVSWGKMAPFIATLATMQIARGCCYLISNGQPIRLTKGPAGVDALADFGSKSIPGISLPWTLLIGLAVVIIMYLFSRYTSVGRIILAIGSNENAVQLSGISVNRYKLLAYIICGITSALAGVVITSRALTGVPITGEGYEMDAIASCVIGGASLSGGRGTVLNTVIGVFVLQLIGNILNLLSVPSYPQQIIKGLVIIVAVLAQMRALSNKK